ncbi:efflux RND transporter periplasmic adaptor subunit [Amaricoccus tamworthensis]|uniref:efflux RND transporter periplasmic adaptor subunit n=1 Tax=Amaricoccus tamworthensis TaxID=57002 RepID=UPI003C7DE831
MRIFSVLSAVVVGLLLYVFIMERDLLRAMAGAETAPAEETAETDTLSEAVAVVAMKSTASTVESGLVLRGRTEAMRRVEVRAEVTGQVVSEPIRRGNMVEKGDLLCRLDPGTRPAALAEARARYLEAEANSKASESLVERGFTSETTAIGNRAALQAAQALIEQAEREIALLEIHAPFSGLLETDTAELGELLRPGSECATIIDLDPIKLIGFAPERSVDEIRVGAQVGARLLTGQEFMGEVSFVSRSADPETRTFRVEATVPNPDLEIRDGITAEILVSLSGRDAHLVRQSALTLNDSGELGIRAVDGDVARFMPVTVIRDTADGVWVAGLPDEVDIIIVGQEFVTDGHPVIPTFQGDM